MTTDNLHRLDLETLFPPFVAKLREALATLSETDTTYVATLGYRTPDEQARLYFQGRTTAGAIVTKARPWYSAHNYGIAVDFCRMLDDAVVSWEPQDFDALGEAVNAVGLVWGGDWKTPDRPHVQWPCFVTAEQLEPLRFVWRQAAAADASPLGAVWAYVTAHTDTQPMRVASQPVPPKGAA